MPPSAVSAGLPVVLSFAASDPTAGAGAQADLLTIAALGAHPVSVLTGVTARDTRGLEAWWPLEPEWVNEQARMLLEDMQVAAFKIGVVGSPVVAAVIAEIVSDYPAIPVVLDPLHNVGASDALDDEMLAALRELLLPLACVLTANGSEARRLAEEDDDEHSPALSECARRLMDLGAEQVLITGVHEHTPQVVNTLYGSEGVIRTDAWERLPGSYHGAGDTLAAAIATHLALGAPLSQAVRCAQEFTWQCLRHAFATGMGQRIPDRFFGLRA